MLKALKRLVSGPSIISKGAVGPVKDLEDDDFPRYPPFAKGFPVAPIEKVLATQAELVERIRNALGLTREEHERLLLPAITNFASFVHFLPASEGHHHRGAGGLFRHGLEVAFWASQASEAVMFAIEGTPRERRSNEPRWRLACCLAGLLHDVGKPLSDVAISNKDGTLIWNPHNDYLLSWAQNNNLDRYFLRWREKRHRRHEHFSLLAIDKILPREVREHLSAPGPEILEQMLEAIAGTSINQPITKLVLKADQESVGRDMRQNNIANDKFSVGVPVDRYVIDAIRRLIKSGKWKVNEPGAKVWHLNQGAFIVWRDQSELYELIDQDKIPAIPRDADTLADVLIERGHAIPNTSTEHGGAHYRYWDVLPDMLQPENGSGEVQLMMLRFESNDLIFTNEPPKPVSAVIVGDVEQLGIEFTDIDDTTASDSETNSTTTETSENVFGFEASSLGFFGGEVAPGENLIAEQATSEEQPKAESSQSKKPAPISSKEIRDTTPALATNDPLKDLLSVGAFAAFDMATPLIGEPEQTVTNINEVGTAPQNTDDTAVNVIDNSGSLTIAKSKDSPKSKTKKESTQTASIDAAMELIRSFGAASNTLEKAFVPIINGENKSLGHTCILGNNLVIPYPKMAEEIGEPSIVMNTLFGAGALAEDPASPNKKVREIKGIKCLVIEKKLAKAIIKAHTDNEKVSKNSASDDHKPDHKIKNTSPPSVNDTTHSTNDSTIHTTSKSKAIATEIAMTEVKGSVNSEENIQLRVENNPQGISDEIAEYFSFMNSDNSTPSMQDVENISGQFDRIGNTSAEENNIKFVGGESKDKTETSKIDTPRETEIGGKNKAEKGNKNHTKGDGQNTARMPKKVAIPKPKKEIRNTNNLARAITSGKTIEMDFQIDRSDEALKDFKPPAKRSEIASIELSSIHMNGNEIGDLTDLEIANQLIQMIENRKGQWLVSAVTEEDGCLVTSEKALDKICGIIPRTSKFRLRASMKTAFYRRVIIANGNIYLKLSK